MVQGTGPWWRGGALRVGCAQVLLWTDLLFVEMDGWIVDLMAIVKEQTPNGRGQRMRGRDDGQMLQTAKSISLFLFIYGDEAAGLQLCRVGYK